MVFSAHRPCPVCREPVRHDATACPHCTRTIPATPQRRTAVSDLVIAGLGLALILWALAYFTGLGT